MSTALTRALHIQGCVNRLFEPVRKAFAENFAHRGEVGGACCVFYRGEKVVDLWGGIRNKRTAEPWEQNTMVVIHSATKGLAAMTLAIAHSRGWLDYEERVCAYWPEFAQNGKARITVRQLLAHQAGLFAFNEPVDRSIVADLDRLAVVMSRQKPAWEPGTRQAYHALTLGFYEGELLRRVDPQHRTLGQFFQDEIASQIGEDVYLRLPEAIPNSRLATLSPPTLIEMLRGFGLRFMFEAMNPRSNIYRALSVNPGTRIYQDAQRVYARDLEVPSGNGVGTARAIAHAYGVFATDGRELGLRRETLDLLAAPAVPPTHGFHDECLKADGVQFSLGFMKSSAVWPFGSTTSFGAPGAGGSLGFADPEAGVGYAYVTSRMGTRLTGDPRDVALRNALYSVLSVPSCASHMEMRPAPQEVAGGVEEFGEGDSLLDTFMPEYDVRERHNIQIHAPASIVLDCASRMDLHQSRAVQAIFRAREFLLGSKPHPIPEGGLLQFTKSIGWRTLAEEPGHEIVMGAITQPWSADVIFKPVFPEEFATLREPDHVKIAWTLRADAVTGDICIFRTETRAVACDESARKKFRRYWRRFRPGIALIRRLMLKPLKREAERQAQRFPQKRTAFP